MSTPPTVGVIEAAAILHVHPKTVEDLIRAGAFPAGKIGRAWVMMTRDVLAYAEKVIIEQTAERMHIPGRRVRVTKGSPRSRSR
ncbi:helix-turn-helix domain-containing protein [Ralstonia thomasii]